MSKFRSHYPDWKMSCTLPQIVQEIVHSVEQHRTPARPTLSLAIGPAVKKQVAMPR